MHRLMSSSSLELSEKLIWFTGDFVRENCDFKMAEFTAIANGRKKKVLISAGPV